MRDLPHNGNLASSATQRAVGPYLELGDYDPWGLKVSVLSGLKARLNSLHKRPIREAEIAEPSFGG
jgi:hypothetical protein